MFYTWDGGKTLILRTIIFWNSIPREEGEAISTSYLKTNWKN